MVDKQFANPYRPGAGHMPPYLAGRKEEIGTFEKLLTQTTILENVVLTGLRGVGKTVLLDKLKPISLSKGWRWVGTDLSESASLNETNMAIRLLTDLSVVTSTIELNQELPYGFSSDAAGESSMLTYDLLIDLFQRAPGLVSDKLKAVLEYVWSLMGREVTPGIIFAYDEAQNLADHTEKDQYPLSVLLDVFQSIQKKDIPFLLVLTGLPTLFPKLVDARTFAERMFHVIFLDRLSKKDSREAILKPLKSRNQSIVFHKDSVDDIISISAGYPYFIQFICREAFDVFLQQVDEGKPTSVPIQSIYAKLDTDFFAGRWSRATDRQRELLQVIAELDNCDREFTVREIVNKSKSHIEKAFSASHVNQMLVALSNVGLIYKDRHGKYAFAVPLLGQFIRRQTIT